MCVSIYIYIYIFGLLNSGKCMQDSDFVAHKDDEGSPTDDSGANNSKGSDNGDEKEACDFCLPLLSL